VAALVAQHAWAGPDLVWAVLSSCGFDLCDAQAALSEMAGGDCDQPGSSYAGGAARGAAAPAGEEAAAGASSNGGGGGSDRAEGDAAAADTYRRHRSEALRATRAWQAALRRAAALRGAGDHSGARAAAREATVLRAAAGEGHREASERIFQDNNKASGLVSRVGARLCSRAWAYDSEQALDRSSAITEKGRASLLQPKAGLPP
jgi:hypothetical protein